jgi:uncharacterized protein YbbK (DUF523 family)
MALMGREQRRPRVGVSACLLGDPVRYNGGHKRHAWLVDVLGRGVEWVPVCPEVEIGLGTPREPIELVRRSDEGVRLITMTTRVDLTERMRRFAERRVDELRALDVSGYVLKADSPSCGLAGVRVADATRPASNAVPGRGMFADVLVARMPELPIVEERDLDEPAQRNAFIERVREYHAKIHP